MKKYLKFGLFVSIFVVLGFVGVKVFAESINSGSGSFSSKDKSPMMVNIGPKGNVLMRGIVVGAPSADSIKVKSWGGSWEVNISATTKLMRVGGVIADFQDGDFVGGLGTLSTDGILDVEDADDDNDGILDVNGSGKSKDHDNGGIPDVTDTDDDGDGIPDVTDKRGHD